MNNENYHQPVLLEACLEGLTIEPAGTYIDVTFGGGGHSRAILQQLGPQGQLFGFDQDEDALANAPKDTRFKLLPFNFRHLKQSLRLEGIKQVDGILADLGVSSHQLDTADRGFSFRFDAQLDMRMHQGSTQSAAHIIKTYSAEDLQELFSRFGEVRNARTLAHRIVDARQQTQINRIEEFIQLIDPCIKGKRNRYLSQVFQSLRMEVNDEIGALKELLQQATELLKPGGRLVVMSYHSLEDRLVKYWIKHASFEKEPVKDIYGNFDKPLKAINRKVMVPTAEEIRENPRARSAKLRIAEKLEED